MKIELKSIQYSERLSEETLAFSANLYINGKIAGTAYNRGHRGPTLYRASDEMGLQLIADAETYCKGLPPVIISSEGKTDYFNMDLEGYIDGLVEKFLKEKSTKEFQNSVNKNMEKGIVVGIPNTSCVLWRFAIPMEKILSHRKGTDLLKEALQKILSQRWLMERPF